MTKCVNIQYYLHKLVSFYHMSYSYQHVVSHSAASRDHTYGTILVTSVKK